MTERPVRVLLIDGQVEDSRWVQDLLLDFSESQFSGSRWMAGIEVFHLQRLEESLLLLSDQTEKGAAATEAFDAVLLNPALPDSFGLPSLLRVQAAAPQLPVLILSDTDDPDLALSVIRAGAQEFLIKSELDCVPLGRAIRLAVERQRAINDWRAMSWREAGTGLCNRNGFEVLGAQAVAACRRMGHLLASIVVEIHGLRGIVKTYGREEREMVLIEAAEAIRCIADPPAAAAHLGDGRFVIAYPTTDPADAYRVAERLRRRLLKVKAGSSRATLQLRLGMYVHQPDIDASVDDLIQAALNGLCENMGVVRPTIADPLIGWYERWARKTLRQTPESKEDQPLAAAHSAGCNS